MILSISPFDGQVVNAGDSTAHQAVFVEFPILVTVGAIPMAGIVVPSQSKTGAPRAIPSA
jgi:hypothetical protein